LWVQAQDYQLNIYCLDDNEMDIMDLVKFKDRVYSEDNAQESLKKVLNQLKQQGYLAASFDSVRVDSTHINAWLHLGKAYKWLQLSPNDIEANILAKIGYQPNDFKNRAFNIQDLRSLQERLLTYAENNGYPFAEVSLTDIEIVEEKIQANLAFAKNQHFTIDSLKINGMMKISPRYLQNYLGIELGMPYNESLMRNISTRIQELSFLSETSPATVRFIGSKSYATLNLKSTKASQFNFLLGLIPKTNEEGFEITGEGLLHLENALGSGEIIGLKYQSFPAQARELEIQFTYPYLPLLPVGLDFNFQLYRKDTSFTDVKYNIGFQYLLKGNNYIKFFFDRKNTNPTANAIDESVVESSGRLPSLMSVRTNAYGLEYQWANLEYRLNPRRGLVLRANASLGAKSYPNSERLTELVDTVLEKSLQYRFQYWLQKYWALGGSATIKTAFTGALLQQASTAQSLFKNELFRIGGNQLLRGFDEQSILADQYHVATVEYRYLLNRNSYFAVFWDGSYTKNATADTATESWFWGVGLGGAFETKAGIFGLSYALGKQENGGLDFRKGKVHFGYVNYF